jgi:hypothetical protein
MRSVAVGLVWLASGSACGGSVEKHVIERADAGGATAGATSRGGQSSAPNGGAMAEAGHTQSAGAPGAGAPGAGAPGSGGEAGSPQQVPCAGVDPWCEPGQSVCDPVLGVRTACSECGEPLPNPTGSPCVRLIATDKESNGVCVVLGQTELQCWQTWGEPHHSVVPSDTTQVFLPDDFSSLQLPSLEPLRLCTRSGASEVSCLGSGCTRVAAGDYGACGICGGQLYCAGQLTALADPPQPLLDVAVTDNFVFVLGASGLKSTFRPLISPTFAEGKPLGLLVDHWEAGCVISDRDELACFESPAESFVASPWRGPFRKVVLQTMPRACVLGMDRRLRCGDVLGELEPQPYAPEDVVDIAASSSLICALTLDGYVQCWDHSAQPLEMPVGW